MSDSVNERTLEEIEKRLNDVWERVSEHHDDCFCDRCIELTAITEEWLANGE